MALIAFCAVSCSDDDDLNEIETPAENAAAKVVGSYEGGNIMLVGGKSSGVIIGTVKIEAQKDGKATVVLPGASVMGGAMQLQPITLNDVKVTSVSASEYNLEYEAFSVVIGNTKYTNTKGLKGSVKDGKLTLAYDLKPGNMPFPIEFNFTMDEKTILNAQVAGAFKGATEMFMGGESSGSFEATVKIETQENGKFTVILPEAPVMGGKMKLPMVTVKDVEATAVKDDVTLKVAAFVVETEDGKKCINKKGMTGSIKNGALTLEYDLQVGNMPFPIDFKFTTAK